MTAIRTKTESAIVAGLIRADLKKAGHKAKVTSKTYSGGNSVNVTLTDPSPGLLRAVQKGLAKYEGGSFDAMQDLYEYRSDRSGPTVKYLFVNADYSGELRQEAWAYLIGYLVGFETAPSSYKEAGMYYNGRSKEWGDALLGKVLRGAIGSFWTARKPRMKLA